MDKLRTFKGKLSRWFRKTFKKNCNSIENGLPVFQELADIYGDNINDIETAELFFNEFMQDLGSIVNVDFLDTENWDCIQKIEVDKQNGLIWLIWQMPNNNPEIDTLRKMVLPLDFYGICLKFDNIRFIRGKGKKCFAICINGYTIRERNIKGFASANGWQITGFDNSSSFFSTNVVRLKDGVSQHWRFMNTPISSFWIIPKMIHINPQKSEKFLYKIGVDKCEEQLKEALNALEGTNKLSKEKQKQVIKTSGNEMRNVAESLFKLVTCFYQEQYHFPVKNYDDLLLGDLIGPLKKTIYTLEFEQARLGEIARIANDLSHDSGNPVTMQDWGQLYISLHYFINDFKSRIQRKGNELPNFDSNGKPSPSKYIKEHYQEFCFLDEINEIVKDTTGKISFTIEVNVNVFVVPFNDNDRLYLCSDGFVRPLERDRISEALKVWNREEVIKLTEKMKERVKTICENEGFDTELSSLCFTMDPILKKEGNPNHLFTEDEIKSLMIAANDETNNKLVIDEDGFPHVIQNPFLGSLYPVSQETWCSGNHYVGSESSLSDLHDSYVLSLHSWLIYLTNGRRVYDDMFIPDDGIEEVLEKINAYYSE